MTARRTLLTAALALAAGCGPAGPAVYEVSGTVTLDGRPLPDGDIVLYARDGDVAADAGEVRGGAFRFRARPGPKRVEITRTAPAPGGVVQNVVPVRYSGDRTVLEAEVVARGRNEFRFDLTSK